VVGVDHVRAPDPASSSESARLLAVCRDLPPEVLIAHLHGSDSALHNGRERLTAAIPAQKDSAAWTSGSPPERLSAARARHVELQ
jgi:hypothetical protein